MFITTYKYDDNGAIIQHNNDTIITWDIGFASVETQNSNVATLETWRSDTIVKRTNESGDVAIVTMG